MSLSRHKLTPCELSLLDRDLSYIPSIQRTTTHADLTDGLQVMELKYIDRYVHASERTVRACRLLKCGMASIKYDLRSFSIQSLKNNLPPVECRALKGDALHYLELAYKHLGDGVRLPSA